MTTNLTPHSEPNMKRAPWYKHKVDTLCKNGMDGLSHKIWFATASAAVATITLPSANGSAGSRYTVKRKSGSANALNMSALLLSHKLGKFRQ